MRLDQFLAKSRIIEIKSEDLKGALRELLAAAMFRNNERLPTRRLLKDLLEREMSMTSYLGNGVALPHTRLKMKRPYIFAVGRCPHGLFYNGIPEYKEVKLLFLLLASEDDKNYLNVLASLARLFNEESVVHHILAAPGLLAFRERVYQGFGKLLAKPKRTQIRFNRLFFMEAEKVAKDTNCSAILIFSDTFAGSIAVTHSFPNYRTVIVSRTASGLHKYHKNIEATIEVRSYAKTRLSQLRSAIIIGLARGIFKHNDRICCLGGLPSSNQLDTLVIIDIEQEFQSVLTRDAELLPASVKVEVIERMLAIATELSAEKREGRSVGGLFVIGDTEKVKALSKPLVLNPFYGYNSEDRNILNPFMDETIKELSAIDGAFIIQGDGVIDSAGSHLHAPAEFYHDLPGGFGARHTAAAAMTRATNSIAIVVSASSSQVTIFRRGVMLPLLEKPLSS